MQIVGRFEDAGFPQLAEISLHIVQTNCLDVDRRSSRSVAYTTKVELEMARPHPVGTLLAPSFAISQSPVGPYRLVVLRSVGLIEFDETACRATRHRQAPNTLFRTIAFARGE